MNRVLVVYGADTKVGTSMIAQTIAEVLAEKRPNDTVCLIHTDGDSGEDYFTFESGGMVAIKQALLNKIATSEEIKEACDVKGNFYNLMGLNDYLTISQFKPEHFQFMIEELKQVFDYIIVDAGSALNSGLTVGALDKENYNLLVTTQNEKSYTKFRTVNSNIFKKIGFKFDKLLINRFTQSTFMPLYKETCEKYEFDDCYLMPNITKGAGLQAENDHVSLNLVSRKEYKKEIIKVVDDLYREEE